MNNAIILIVISLIYSISKKPKTVPVIAPGIPKKIPLLAILISPYPPLL